MSVWKRMLAVMLLAMPALGLVSCGGGGGGGGGGGQAGPAVFAIVDAPEGTVGGDSVVIAYVLFSDESVDADITAEFSTDGGQTWDEADANEASPAHDGTEDLATSPEGENHTFVWDTTTDVPPAYDVAPNGDLVFAAAAENDVKFRIRPNGTSNADRIGTSTNVFVVDNDDDATAPVLDLGNATATANPGFSNDVVEVVFDEPMNMVEVLDSDNFDLIVAGNPVDLSGAQFEYDNVTFTVTITLLETDTNLENGAAFTIEATGVSDRFGNVIVDNNTTNIDGGNVAGDADAPELVAAVAFDVDSSGTVTVGDRVRLFFSEDVSVTPGNFSGADVTLPVGGDTLGGAGLAIAATADASVVDITLGAAPFLTAPGTYPGTPGATGLGMSGANDTIVDPAGNTPDATIVDLKFSGDDTTKPTITNSSATAVSGKENDTFTVTFSEGVNPSDATDRANYTFRSPATGDAFNLAGVMFTYDAGNFKVTATLDDDIGFHNLLFGEDYEITVNNVRDYAGNVINANSGTDGTVGGDGAVGADKPDITTVVFTNTNLNGVEDQGDKLEISFDEVVMLDTGAATAADFLLPVAGDLLGTNPFFTQVDDDTIRIVLGAGAALTFLGTYDSGTVVIGSPSGLGFAAANDALSDLAGNLPATGAANAVDITNADAVAPQLNAAVATAVSNKNNDTVVVTFSEDVLETDAETPGNFTLETPDNTPVNISTATFVYDSGTDQLTITIDGNGVTNGVNLQHGATFDIIAANVRDLAGNPVAGMTSIQGNVIGDGDNLPADRPDLTNALWNDQDLSLTPTAGDFLDLVFNEDVTVTGAAFTQGMAAPNDVFLSMGGDTIGAGATIANVAGDERRVRITLGAGPVFDITGNSDIRVNTNADAMADLAGNTAGDDANVITIEAFDDDPPVVTTGTATTVAGLLNDTFTVTFNEDVNSADAEDPANYDFESPTGVNVNLTGATGNYVALTKTVTFTVTPNLKTGATFKVTVTGVRDLSNNTIVNNGATNVFSGNVGGDNTAPTIASVVYTNVNLNGIVDAGDTLTVNVNPADPLENVSANFNAADITLANGAGDSLGTNPTMQDVDADTFRITLGAGANLTISTTTLAGSGANNAIFDAAGNKLSMVGVVIANSDANDPDITGALAAAVPDSNNDTVTITFNEDLLDNTGQFGAENINNYTLTHNGNPVSLATSTVAYDAGTDQAVITVVGTNLKRGVAFTIAVANVRDLNGNTISNVMNPFAGMVGGDSDGPNPVSCNYNDVNGSMTVNAGDTLTVVFDEDMDIVTAQFHAADVATPFGADTIGSVTNADISQAGSRTIVITLKNDTVLANINGTYPAASGIGFNPPTGSIQDNAGNEVTNVVVDVAEEDLVAPQVAGGSATAVSGLNNDTIIVNFSEIMVDGAGADGAENPANYALTVGGQAQNIAAATFSYTSSPSRLTITLSNGLNLTFNAAFSIVVTNVEDLFGNVVDPNNDTASGNVGGDNTAPSLQQAIFTNVNQNGLVDAGDTLDLVFNEDMVITIANFDGTPNDLRLPVSGDTLGTSPTVAQPSSTTARITLGANPTLTVPGMFNNGNLGAGNPSGVNSGTSNNCIRDAAGNAFSAAGGGVDITNNDVAPPGLASVDLVTVSGLDNDILTVVFDQAVLASDATDITHYQLETPNGSPVMLTGFSSVSYNSGNLTATITLDSDDANPNTGDTFTVTGTGIRDLSGNLIDDGNNSDGGMIAGNDNVRPVLQSASYIDNGTPGVNGGDFVLMVSDEELKFAGIIDQNDVEVLGTGNLGAGPTLQLLSDKKTVRITLGANPTIVPAGAFPAPGASGIRFVGAGDIVDLAGNHFDAAFAGVDIGESDSTAPIISFVSLNDIDRFMNGTFPGATGTLLVPRGGFIINGRWSDAGGSLINTNSVTVTSNTTVDGIAPGQDLVAAGKISILTSTQTEYRLQVAGAITGTTFPTGNSTISVRVRDGQGNQANAANFTFTVAAATNSNRPLENGNVWYVRFDRDMWTYNNIDVPVSSSTDFTQTANGQADFIDDMLLFGLNTGLPGGDELVPNDPMGRTVNVAMQDLMKQKILDRVEFFYDGVNLTFVTTEPAAWPISEPTVQYNYGTSADYSRISIGGDSKGRDASGLAWYDNKNQKHEDDYSIATSNIFTGVFPARTFDVNDDSAGTPMRNDFDPFLNGVAGGVPVGQNASDKQRVEYLINGSGGLNDARTAQIVTAIDHMGSKVASTLAHEIGHSLGLVANTAQPAGLHGAADGAFNSGATSTSHHFRIDRGDLQAELLDTDDNGVNNDPLYEPPSGGQGAVNIMAPSSFYSEGYVLGAQPNQLGKTRFNSLILAYLKEITLINGND